MFALNMLQKRFTRNDDDAASIICFRFFIPFDLADAEHLFVLLPSYSTGGGDPETFDDESSHFSGVRCVYLDESVGRISDPDVPSSITTEVVESFNHSRFSEQFSVFFC